MLSLLMWVETCVRLKNLINYLKPTRNFTLLQKPICCVCAWNFTNFHFPESCRACKIPNSSDGNFISQILCVVSTGSYAECTPESGIIYFTARKFFRLFSSYLCAHSKTLEKTLSVEFPPPDNPHPTTLQCISRENGNSLSLTTVGLGWALDADSSTFWCLKKCTDDDNDDKSNTLLWIWIRYAASRRRDECEVLHSAHTAPKSGNRKEIFSFYSRWSFVVCDKSSGNSNISRADDCELSCWHLNIIPVLKVSNSNSFSFQRREEKRKKRDEISRQVPISIRLWLAPRREKGTQKWD